MPASESDLLDGDVAAVRAGVAVSYRNSGTDRNYDQILQVIRDHCLGCSAFHAERGHCHDCGCMDCGAGAVRYSLTLTSGNCPRNLFGYPEKKKRTVASPENPE